MRTRFVTDTQGFWLPETRCFWAFDAVRACLEPLPVVTDEALFSTQHEPLLGRFSIQGCGHAVVSVSSPRVFDCCPRETRRLLWHGDQVLVISGGDDPVRVTGRAFVEPELPLVERLQSLEAAPDDEGLWEVFIDELLAAGDPLGSYMVGAGCRRVLDDADAHRVEHYGFTSALSVCIDLERDDGRLPLDSPFSRFLRDLEVRFAPGHLVLQDHRAQGLLFGFRSPTFYPCLRRLALLVNAPPSLDLKAAAEAVREVRPALDVVIEAAN